MNILEYLRSNNLYLDGGMGTLLQKAGLAPGELPELWNITKPDVIRSIHRDYFDAGSNVVVTNTFGANILKYDESVLENIVSAAVKNARDAAAESSGTQEKWVALDIGPSGKMLAPYGDLNFEDAVELFAKTVRLGVKYGVDLIFIETMGDSYETKAALLAAKECSNLPVFVSCAYGEDGKLMTGATPSAMVAMLEGLGADAIGANCSLGPSALVGVISEYLKNSSLPVILKPNAGLPRCENGKTVYDVSPTDFASQIAELMKLGVSAVGGCCGTTPEYIKSLVEKTKNLPRIPTIEKDLTVVSSYTHAVLFDKKPILIGERINPTGKKRFKEALRSGEIDYILSEGIRQQECGSDILDVNVGLPEIDEVSVLESTVKELQAVSNLPLQIDTANPEAMEKAARCYNGKPMLNSVSGKKESMDAVFPIAKKYGGLIVALTLDENGIPKTAEGRFEIAEKILAYAKKFGIKKKNIIFDPLAMAVSADSEAAHQTLSALKMINERLGAKTSLGISNVSFGLPSRDMITASYFTMALANGLSAAIMNPYSSEMKKAYLSYLALSGLDENFENYISFASTIVESVVQSETKTVTNALAQANDLKAAIVRGLKERAKEITCELLKTRKPLDIVNEDIIPALNTVGEGFEKKTVYLPGLLMSAEAAKFAFEEIKATSADDTKKSGKPIVIATVKGDIHDIGKNIVRLLLENYGFNVVDLGRDVDELLIVDAAKKHSSPLVALSALMTTTVPAMQRTIELLNKELPTCKVLVGGAVLTKEYADMIGADAYAKDALSAVRYAENLKLK